MNYAIESIDMSDFCRLYSGKYKKNYKVENPGTEKMLFRDRRAVNAHGPAFNPALAESAIALNSVPEIHNSVKLSYLCRTFPHFKNFYDSGDLIRAEI